MGQKEDESLIRLINATANRTYQWRIDGLLQLQDLASQSDDIQQLKYWRTLVINSMSDFEDTVPDAAKVRDIANYILKVINERLSAAIAKKKEGNNLGGLKTTQSTDKVKAYYEVMKGKYIHTSTKESDFIAMFQDKILPLEWNPIKWIGSRKDCFSFMMEMCGDEIKAGTINKYIQQYAIDSKTKKLNTKELTSNQRTNCNRGFLKGL